MTAEKERERENVHQVYLLEMKVKIDPVNIVNREIEI